MLSKRKKTSYNSYLFRSVVNEERYLLYPEDKKFVQEKSFKLNEGEFDDIQANIVNRGWRVFTSYAEPASRQLAMEFFANAYQQNEANKDHQAKYTSYVRGQTVPYTPVVINQIFGLENIQQCAYEQRCKAVLSRLEEDQMAATLCSPGKDWERNLDGTTSYMKTTKLNPTAKAWATFVLHTLLPSSNVSELTIQEARLVTTIILGEPINIGRILATELYQTAWCDPKGSWLIEASLIGRLCELVGVKAMMNEVLIKPGPPITKKWIYRYCILSNTDADPQQQHVDILERLDTRMQQMELSQREGQARLERGMLALYRAFAYSQAGHAFDPSPDIFAPQAPGEGDGAGGQDEDVNNRPPILRTYSRRKVM